MTTVKQTTYATFSAKKTATARVYSVAAHLEELKKIWDASRMENVLGGSSLGVYTILLTFGGRKNKDLMSLKFNENITENLDASLPRIAPFSLMNTGKAIDCGVLEVSADQLSDATPEEITAEIHRHTGIAQMEEHGNKVSSRNGRWINRLGFDTFERAAKREGSLFEIALQDATVKGIKEPTAHSSQHSRGFELKSTEANSIWTRNLTAEERPIDERVNFEIFKELKRNKVKPAKTPINDEAGTANVRDGLTEPEEPEESHVREIPEPETPEPETHAYISCPNFGVNINCRTRFEISIDYLVEIFRANERPEIAKLPKCGHCDVELIVPNETMLKAQG